VHVGQITRTTTKQKRDCFDI